MQGPPGTQGFTGPKGDKGAPVVVDTLPGPPGNSLFRTKLTLNMTLFKTYSILLFVICDIAI